MQTVYSLPFRATQPKSISVVCTGGLVMRQSAVYDPDSPAVD